MRKIKIGMFCMDSREIGHVLSDLSGHRRGKIEQVGSLSPDPNLGLESPRSMRIQVRAQVPLAEMTGLSYFCFSLLVLIF